MRPRRRSQELLEHLEPGDTIIDGGNTNFHDDVRRHEALKAKGIGYVDAGTSGGIWGLQVGYCLMVGGDPEVVTPLEPVFTSLAPKGGYLHVGGPGRRALREDGPQRHRVRLDAGVRRRLRDHARERLRPDLAAISELWMQGSVVRSWLLELAGRAFRANGPDLGAPQGLRVADSAKGRWTVQDAIDLGRSRARSSRAAHSLRSSPGRLATVTGCWPCCATSSAATRSRRSSATMAAVSSSGDVHGRRSTRPRPATPPGPRFPLGTCPRP